MSRAAATGDVGKGIEVGCQLARWLGSHWPAERAVALGLRRRRAGDPRAEPVVCTVEQADIPSRSTDGDPSLGVLTGARWLKECDSLI